MGRTELLELDGEALEGMSIEKPEIAHRMIQRMATCLMAAERRLAALGLDELVDPLVRALSARGAPRATKRFKCTRHSGNWRRAAINHEGNRSGALHQ